VFQRDSLVAIVGAANRRVERLIQCYRRQGDDARAPAAEALRLVMLELQQQSERLARAADAPDAAALRDQIEALLDRSELGPSVLLTSASAEPVRRRAARARGRRRCDRHGRADPARRTVRLALTACRFGGDPDVAVALTGRIWASLRSSVIGSLPG
jgi:hypothetical protein